MVSFRHMCTSAHQCVFAVATIYPWAMFAWSNTSTSNDSSAVKPLSVRDGSVRSTCLSPLLSSPICWFSVFEPWGRHFLFLAGVLTPLPALSGFPRPRHHVIYCPESSVCRVNTAWLVKQGSNLLLSHTHIYRCAHTMSRDHPGGRGGGWLQCLPRYSRYTWQSWEPWTQRQTDTDFHNPSKRNLPQVSKSYSRTENVML